MRKEYKEYLDYILDCFSGVDGGVLFTNFKNNLEVIDKQAEMGDAPSEEVMKVVAHFSKLIKILGEI